MTPADNMLTKKYVDQQVLEAIEQVKRSMHTYLESVYDDTRVYKYGVAVRIGFAEPHSPTKIINDMRDWCNNTFGPKPYGEYYGDRWMVSNNTFWFKNERDRTLFLLQFGQ